MKFVHFFLRKQENFIYFFLPIAFLLILLGIGDMSLTQDLGRHIKTGEIIVNCKCIPDTNLYSYTQADFPFYNHHWLPEVFFYYVHMFFGFGGIFAFKVMGIVLAFGTSYYLAFKKNKFWAFIFSFFFIYVLSERFDSRPEIFSFIFISLFLFLIEKFRQTRNIKYLFPFPLIELVWVNSHIYFIVGIVIFSALFTSEFIQNKKKLDRSLLLLFVLTLLAVFINPSGFKGGFLPFTILESYPYSIVENQNIFFLNTFFSSARILTFEILASIFTILFLVNLKKNDIFYSLISVFSLVSSLVMIRNFPIFVLVALPYMTFLASVTEGKIQDSYFIKNTKILLIFILIIFVPYRVYKIITYPIYGWGIVDAVGPGVDYLQKNNITGPIFNNFDVGGYLIYRLYPKEKVFVDARPEAYSKKSFDEYRKMQYEMNFFNKQVKRYNISTVFFSHGDLTPWGQAFLSNIERNNNWKKVYFDDWVVIYKQEIKP